MNAIIIGAGGQDGYFLTELLRQSGIVVTGVDRNTGLDLRNQEQVAGLFESRQPDYIFHLAANSTTSLEAWKENHDTICTGTMNILNAAQKFSPSARIFISGSGLQFVNKGIPIKETDEFYPSSLYALSRIQSVYAARYYREKGLKVYVGYFFNHDSEMRNERHINKKIALAAKSIAAGSQDQLVIGDPFVEKEFGYAGDIVKAVWLLVNQDKVYEATIGTGESHSIAEWASECFERLGLNWKDYVISDPNFTPEYKKLVSNPSTIFSLGWRPRITFSQLAEIMSR